MLRLLGLPSFQHLPVEGSPLQASPGRWPPLCTSPAGSAAFPAVSSGEGRAFPAAQPRGWVFVPTLSTLSAVPAHVSYCPAATPFGILLLLPSVPEVRMSGLSKPATVTISCGSLWSSVSSAKGKLLSQQGSQPPGQTQSQRLQQQLSCPSDKPFDFSGSQCSLTSPGLYCRHHWDFSGLLKTSRDWSGTRREGAWESRVGAWGGPGCAGGVAGAAQLSLSLGRPRDSPHCAGTHPPSQEGRGPACQLMAMSSC